ncbi:gamma-crystallin M3-like [Syngnathoides biaculeatus]|uniref:gamma-crystallin M3-like n=1 Tax=Syngnathoides biaculeatus TaxID=300417 RepID=UPI002ADDE4AD|nr:gamma-crystallin M3-like [Syngnathoides biaculeatus]
MGKIILFEEKNFQGRSYECLSDCADLSTLNKCLSCRVESGCFMIYERTNFMGNQHFLRRGEYSDCTSLIGLSSGIKSCRMIPVHRGQFKIKIFERENLSGQMNELVDDCENILERFGMTECLSCQVLEGPWLLFELPNLRGKMLFVKPGDNRSFREMGLSTTRFMSMRRITDSC